MFNNIYALLVLNYVYTLSSFVLFLSILNSKYISKKLINALSLYYYFFFSGLPIFSVFFFKVNFFNKILNTQGNALIIVFIFTLFLFLLFIYTKTYFSFVSENIRRKNNTLVNFKFAYTYIYLNLIFNVFVIIPLLITL